MTRRKCPVCKKSRPFEEGSDGQAKSRPSRRWEFVQVHHFPQRVCSNCYVFKPCGSDTCDKRRVHHERPDVMRSRRQIAVLKDHVGTVFCSIECSCYAGYYSIAKGWLKDPRTGYALPPEAKGVLPETPSNLPVVEIESTASLVLKQVQKEKRMSVGRPDTFTPGPWGWDAQDSDRGYRHIRLGAHHHGGLVVMDFVRLGMGDAQPRFRRGDQCVMEKAFHFGTDKDHHGSLKIDHPDALLIAAAPDLYVALAALVEKAYHEDSDGMGNTCGSDCSACKALQALAKARGEKRPPRREKTSGRPRNTDYNDCG